MESASQSDVPPGEPPSRFANLLGVAVAILTLTLPLVAIAYFSEAPLIPAQTPYSFPRPPD